MGGWVGWGSFFCTNPPPNGTKKKEEKKAKTLHGANANGLCSMPQIKREGDVGCGGRLDDRNVCLAKSSALGARAATNKVLFVVHAFVPVQNCHAFRTRQQHV